MKSVLSVAIKFTCGMLALGFPWMLAFAQADAELKLITNPKRTPPIVAQMDLRDWGAMGALAAAYIGNTAQPYGWLDSKRVVIAAPMPNRPYWGPFNNDQEIAIWDIEKNTVKILGVYGTVSCVDPVSKHIAISIPDETLPLGPQGYPQRMMANVSFEAETPRIEKRRLSEEEKKALLLNPFTCRLEPSLDKINDGFFYVPLRPEHGRLRGKEGVYAQNFPMEHGFLNSSGVLLVTYSSLASEMHYAGIRYLPFIGQYFMSGNLSIDSDFDPKNPRTVRFLSPNGTVKVLEVPLPLWKKTLAREGWIKARAAKPGVLWVYEDRKSKSFDGIYLQQGSSLERISPVTDFVVGPDGCRTAMVLDRKNTVVDLCQ